MKFFNLKNNRVEEIAENIFRLEKDIQSLIEANVEEIFNLKFIASELSVDKYRFDTLCFDEENNSFTIIEYKKGENSSLIDQGFAYLSLLLKNKAKFILELSHYYDKVMKEKDVDWSQSRLIFIAPSFTSYQKECVNFKDVLFELWEIKKYGDHSIILNQHLSTSKESINILTTDSAHSDISTVNKEIKVYTIEEHLSQAGKKIADKWNAFIEKLHKELNDVELITTKNYIKISCRRKSIGKVWFQKQGIKLEIRRGMIKADGDRSKNSFDLDDPKGIVEKSTDERGAGSRNFKYYIYIDKNTDLEYLMFLVKQKYNHLLSD